MYRILKGASLLEASELRVTDLESGVTERLLPGISIFGPPSHTYAISQDDVKRRLPGSMRTASARLGSLPLDRRSPPGAVPLRRNRQLGLRGMSPDGRWLVTLTVTNDEQNGVTGRSIIARSLAGEGELPLIAPIGAPDLWRWR